MYVYVCVCVCVCVCVVCRMVHLVRDYSMKRVCFGKTIKDHKLHVKNLANMEVRPSLFDCEMVERFIKRFTET